MYPAVLLALCFGAMFLVLAAGYCAMLVFHNPYRPQWLNDGWPDNTVTILLITAAIFDFAWVLKLLYGMGVDPLAGLAIEAAAIIFAASVLWRWMHMSERLDAAKRGLSPFSELRHIRHRRRGDFGPGPIGTA